MDRATITESHLIEVHLIGVRMKLLLFLNKVKISNRSKQRNLILCDSTQQRFSTRFNVFLDKVKLAFGCLAPADRYKFTASNLSINREQYVSSTNRTMNGFLSFM